MIQTRASHYIDENELQESFIAYDFVGQVTKSKMVHHINPSKTISMTERFEYDHVGRLEKAWHQMDDQTEILMTENFYNELGELIDKKLHYNEEASDYVQSVDYRYNIRGWLTSINNTSRTNETGINDDSSDLFGMNLMYNTDDLGIGTTTQLNGNISSMSWSNASYDGTQKAYGFDYDKLNRLTAANYKEKTTSSWTVNTDHFSVTGIKYDQNGNIEELNRKETNTLIDDLLYSYEGNRLLAVNDQQNHDSGFKDGEESSEEYLYDANGNMITDKNKEIQTIEYNLLNLPEKITFENGNYLEYMYDASGSKLAKKVYESATLTKYTDYVGGMIFDNDTLKIIQTAEGRIVADLVANDYAYDYQYHLKDHLGNNRVVFKSDEVVYTATMESELATSEEAEFNNINQYRTSLYNNTVSGGEITNANESILLNPALTGSPDGSIIGAAKGLKVYPGDEIDLEVYARFDDPVADQNLNTINNFVFMALAGAYGLSGGVSEPTKPIYDAINTELSVGILGENLQDQSINETPAAYLNYIYFDKNYENAFSGHAAMP